MTQTEKGLMPSTATPEADKISGLFGLLQAILSRYNLVWIMIITPLVTLYFRSLLESLWAFIKSSIGL